MSQLVIDQSFIEKAIHSKLSFAMWRKPNSSDVHFSACNAGDLIEIFNFQELDKYNGFVFSPFEVCKNHPIFIIPDIPTNQLIFNDSTVLNTGEYLARTNILSDEFAEKQHIKNVEKFIRAFSQAAIKKAVLSRKKWIGKYNLYQMPLLFQNLVNNYPNAFVYQVFIPQAGYWVGATPELLFSTNNSTVRTVSLAGTQVLTGDPEQLTWKNKEKVEQELVTEHIRFVLKEFGIHAFNEAGPETIKAGKLAHLKTTIDFQKNLINNNIGQFIKRLHPTPAICGLPVAESLELIFQTEQFDREYYCGFLGPFHPAGASDLYVNLRCLKAYENGVELYAGGGITPDSDPQNEWEETCLKINTIKQILDQL